MLPTEIVDTVDGKFLVFPNDTLGQHLKRGDRWETHITKLAEGLLRPGDVAVDIGANIGCTAVVMARAVGETGRVLAFEPLRITYQQLCGNVILNGLENVFTYNLALGSADNVTVSMVPVDYHTPDINIMNSCLGLGGDVVQMKTLDSFNLSGIKIIKIDVQGSELLVLKGCVQTVERNRPIIFIEIEEPQLRHQNTSSQEVMTKILSMNYSLIYLKGDSLVDWVGVPAENKEALAQVTSLIDKEYEVFTVP